jgi:phosphoribosylformylglycinamidine synthase
MCFGGEGGAHLFVPSGRDAQTFLFNETAGCFVVELDAGTDPQNVFGDMPHALVGTTLSEARVSAIESDKLNSWNWDGNNLFEASVEELKKAWQQPMKELFE